MSARVISIVNQKGGVGKTTTAVNLSSFVSELSKTALLIDFDPQANASSGIGLKNTAVSCGIYELLAGNIPFQEGIYPTPFQNLHIIPATQALAGAEVELAQVENREYVLSRIIAPLKDHYDYIFIDCAPSLGLLTVNALTASDDIIIPVQCEYFALEGVAQLLETISRIRQSLNEQLSVSGIVLTMFDPRTSLNKSVVHNARVFFKDLIFDTIIPRNITLAEAPSHGLPISLYSPASKGAYSYLQLAKEFIHRVKN